MRIPSLTLVASLALAACDRPAPEPTTAPAPPPTRWYQPEHAAAGEPLFQANCAVCHGAAAQGAPDWRKVGADGKYPPPPLNGTGHAWHHPLAALHQVIMNGSPGGQGNMPPWRGRLSQAEVLAIIAWFQSHWPDEIYRAWQEIDARSRG